jgi:hypothetical protein
MEGGNMKRTLGSALIALAFVFGTIAMTSTRADAQWRNRSYGGYDNQQIQQGYQYGLSTGAADAQRGQSNSPQRSRYYRDASSQAFREGFVRGYAEGYRQYSGNRGGNGGYRNDGYYGNDDYRNGRRNDSYGGYNDREANNGYQQGLNTGASDGQSNKGYSPQRSRYYQNASTQAYRDGFVRGYDEGYRRYSRNRSYRRNNAGTILDQIFRRPY